MKLRSAALLLAACAFAPLHAADAPAAKNEPVPYCRFGTGKNDKGDFEVLVRRFRNPETGREVTLAGMVHLADAAFYAKIDKLADAHDVVLLEGVKGTPSFISLPLLYKSLLGHRLMDPASLDGQREHLRSTGPNRRNADVSMSDMDDKTGISLELVQLPFVVGFGEAAYTLETVAEQFAWLTGSGDDLARTTRRLLASELSKTKSDDMDEDFERVVLHDRNNHLLGILDDELRKPGSKRILIPWGAAHHPELEEGLRKRGFTPAGDEWLTAMAVKHLGSSPENEPGFRWRLPYALRLRFSDTTSEVDGPLSLLSYGDTPRAHEHSSLWGILHSREVTDTESSFSLLAGLGWSFHANREKGETANSALAGLWREAHSPLNDSFSLGWWGFLGGASTQRDEHARVESSSWHLPFTFGKRPLLYRHETDGDGRATHRFLLFFKLTEGE